MLISIQDGLVVIERTSLFLKIRPRRDVILPKMPVIPEQTKLLAHSSASSSLVACVQMGNVLILILSLSGIAKMVN